MSLRIFPMPKIEFLSSEHGNIAKLCGFFIGDTLEKDVIIIWGNGTRSEIKIKENQTFEQAVTEWVKQYVITHFEGIAVPDIYDPLSNDRSNSISENGYNDAIKDLLSLNPNVILEG